MKAKFSGRDITNYVKIPAGAFDKNIQLLSIGERTKSRRIKKKIAKRVMSRMEWIDNG